MFVVLSPKLLAFDASETFAFFAFSQSTIVLITTALIVVIFMLLSNARDGLSVAGFTSVSCVTPVRFITTTSVKSLQA